MAGCHNHRAIVDGRMCLSVDSDFPTTLTSLPFELGETPINKAELKRASRYFEQQFIPTLTQNGFIRYKNKWYRKYCDYQIQCICFLTYPNYSNCSDLRIICDFTTLASSPLSIYMLCDNANDLQQRLVQQVYPGCESGCTKSRLVYDENYESFKRVSYNSPSYFSCYCARKKGDTLETCIKREYNLFLDHTLPLLNSFQTPQSYINYIYTKGDEKLLSTFYDNRFYLSSLWCCDWDSAFRSCKAAIISLTEKGEKVEALQKDLQHILHCDSIWAQELIAARVKENIEIFKNKYCFNNLL